MFALYFSRRTRCQSKLHVGVKLYSYTNSDWLTQKHLIGTFPITWYLSFQRAYSSRFLANCQRHLYQFQYSQNNTYYIFTPSYMSKCSYLGLPSVVFACSKVTTELQKFIDILSAAVTIAITRLKFLSFLQLCKTKNFIFDGTYLFFLSLICVRSKSQILLTFESIQTFCKIRMLLMPVYNLVVCPNSCNCYVCFT